MRVVALPAGVQCSGFGSTRRCQVVVSILRLLHSSNSLKIFVVVAILCSATTWALCRIMSLHSCDGSDEKAGPHVGQVDWPRKTSS